MNMCQDTDFAQEVAHTIEAHDLLPEKRVIVALSGGADSVALLRVLLQLGYDCTAAHCNFKLRGAESDRDEHFAEQLCGRLGIDLARRSFDTAGHARRLGISVEMAARELRYDFFAEVAQRKGMVRVAVAHHRDDNAETVLLNMVRGTGIKGLTGMAYCRDGIVRPLLDVSRNQILKYLSHIGQDYVDDSTNAVANVKRNVIRLRLMPILRELNPSIENTLVENAHRLREVYDHLCTNHLQDKLHRDNNGNILIQKADIDSHLSLHMLLGDMGFTPEQIDKIWEHRYGRPGAIYKSETHELLRDRDAFIIKELHAEPARPKVVIRIADASEFRSLRLTDDIACLDADKVGDNIEVRTVREGDRFVPLGMRGSKLVSDFLTDRKVNLFAKREQLVVTNGRDIVWLAGRRPDDRYKVKEGTTRRLLICKLENNINKTTNF